VQIPYDPARIPVRTEVVVKNATVALLRVIPSTMKAERAQPRSVMSTPATTMAPPARNGPVSASP
jgi:hypothetical protein